MKYFLLSITNKCNKSCPYCVVKQWRNNPDYPDTITMSQLCDWLEVAGIASGDLVEITGGEPTLRDDLLYLLEFLKDKQVNVILRTNGRRLGEWRKEFSKMLVLLAQHDSVDSYVQILQQMYLLPKDIILKNVEVLDSCQKAQKVVYHKELGLRLNYHKFAKTFFVTADGVIRCMPCSAPDLGSIWQYTPKLYGTCEKCDYLLNAWSIYKNFFI